MLGLLRVIGLLRLIFAAPIYTDCFRYQRCDDFNTLLSVSLMRRFFTREGLNAIPRRRRYRRAGASSCLSSEYLHVDLFRR